MATMVLGGLWHGANWTFAAWGVWHGLLLVLQQGASTQWERVSAAWQRNITFFFVTLGWVFFRAEDFSQARRWFAGLTGIHGFVGQGTTDMVALLALVAVCLVIVRAFPNSMELPLDRLAWLPQVGLAAATTVALLLMNYGSKFLYFQF
jgi:D-alanyl-lipoteichoic acid acyltransferase DltB (MBOAT superfamily)